MQHYINYGYGFPSSLLTEDEFDRVMDQNFYDYDTRKYNLSCVSFTEDECTRGWSCIVLYPLGEVNSPAKMITMSEINKISLKYGTISKDRKEKFLEVLATAGLGHYVDKVELVFYSDNY